MSVKISLDDKYTLRSKRAYMTGIEALVLLPILQHQRDVDRGLNTAAFISGYRPAISLPTFLPLTMRV